MAHVATITIDHTKVPGDLTDYVGLIVPDGSAGYSALYALCLEGGGDIRLFKSDDTTELAREIVTFSVTDETGEIHYRYAGTLSSSVDTDIHVYADGSSSDYAVGATYGRNAVWGDYLFVSHDGGGTDSTGTYTPTANGSVSAGDVSGKIGVATNFDGNNQYFTLPTGVIVTGNADRTVSLWYASDAASAFSPFSFGKGGGTSNADFAARIISDRIKAQLWGGADLDAMAASVPGYLDGSWRYLATTHTSGTLRILYDGSQVASGSRTLGTTANEALIGSWYLSNGAQDFVGDIGEFRYSDSANSNNHIAAEYNNQNANGSFWEATDAGGGGAAQAARRGAVMMM